MNLSILGPQGCGKGTQADMLTKKFHLEHIDIGLLLRQEALKKTKFGRTLNEIINHRKELVSDAIMAEVLISKLKKLKPTKGIILDGAPRRLSQIATIEESLISVGRKIDKVIFVRCSQQESIKRISNRYHCYNCSTHYVLGKDIKSPKEVCRKCGGKIVRRVDDTPAGVRKRLAIFKKETLPVIRWYKKQKKLIEVNGEEEIFAVQKKMAEQLKKLK
jgi:adenylate kinase